jgi:hypothetical protein
MLNLYSVETVARERQRELLAEAERERLARSAPRTPRGSRLRALASLVRGRPQPAPKTGTAKRSFPDVGQLAET